MATISKQRRNEATILTSFSISKRNEPAYSSTCKDRSEANPAYSTNWTDRSEAKSVYSTNSKERSRANSVYSTNWTDRSEAKSVYSTNSKNRLIPEIGMIEAKKNELDRSKTNRGRIFKTFMGPRNRFQGIDSASLCPGGPVQQPYSSSVPTPLRLF
jgi:hypothetical protein